MADEFDFDSKMNHYAGMHEGAVSKQAAQQAVQQAVQQNGAGRISEQDVIDLIRQNPQNKAEILDKYYPLK